MFLRELLQATFGWLFFVLRALQMLKNLGVSTVSNKPPIAAKRSLRVLVAEDNVTHQKLAIAALISLGATGVVVNDSAKALRCLVQLPFDLVLTEVVMPDMDGMAALNAIRRGEAPEASAGVVQQDQRHQRRD